MTLRPLLLSAALALAPIPALADWTFDKAHSAVFFEVGHLGFSTVTGTFTDIAADVTFDPDDIAATTVSVTINADSVTTFWPARDQHLLSADFLDVENYPQITFVSTGIETTGDDTALLTGDMTIKGTTNSETFEVTLNKVDANPFDPGQNIAGFSITGDIDRTDYGIDFGAPVIGAVLPLNISVELTSDAEAS